MTGADVSLGTPLWSNRSNPLKPGATAGLFHYALKKP